MKKIKYFLCVGNDIYPKIIPHSAENEEIAKREAFDGVITPYDDGEPEPVYEPTTDEIMNALLGV